MTHDGENRPLTVTSANGDLTEYVYAADGTRLKRRVTEAGVTTTSLYFGEVEIVNPAPGASSAEVINWYPHPNVKIARTRAGGTPVATTTYLHRDQRAVGWAFCPPHQRYQWQGDAL
jgi:YD repeat-containing protein